MDLGSGYYYAAAAVPLEDRVRGWLTQGIVGKFKPPAVTIVESRLIFVPFVSIAGDFVTTWDCDIGTVDQGSLNIANNHYLMARNHAKNCIVEAQQFQRSSDHIVMPDAPDECDFLRWHGHDGETTGTWHHGPVLMAHTFLHGCPAPVDDLVQGLFNSLSLDGAPGYTTLKEWTAGVPNWRTALIPPKPLDMEKTYSGSVESYAARIVGQRLPRHYANFHTRTHETTYRITSTTIIPVYVVTYQVGNETALCLIDGVRGTMAIGTKLHTLKHAIGNAFASLWTKRPAAAKSANAQ